MIFSNPIPFAEALASRKAKRLLPTKAGSRELAKLGPQILNQAMFSAKVTNSQFLAQADKLINGIVSPLSSSGPDGRKSPLSRIEARAELQNYLDSIKYQAPKGKEGGLQDLRSNARINLIVDTNVKMAHGFGQNTLENDPDILDDIPCKELYRLGARKAPRDWISRWLDNGGKLYSGRMIARKDDPVWTAISRFGNAWPPFDYNSGMWTREITRTEAEQLGVIKRSTVVKPSAAKLTDNVSATMPQGISKGLADALLNAFKDTAVLEAGKLILKGAAA